MLADLLERNAMNSDLLYFRLLLIYLLIMIVPDKVLSAQICLKNGDCLHGQIVDQTETMVTIQHSNLGLLVIPLDETVALSVPVDADPTVANSDAKELPEQWKHRVFLGFGGEEGNDVGFHVKTGFSSSYEDDFDRWNITARYHFETEDNEKDDSKGHFHITKDWLNPETPWLYFLQWRYHYDSFKYWKHRVTFFVGLGYDFVKLDNFDFIGRAGIGGSRTRGVDDRLYPEGLLGIEMAWRPNEINELLTEVTVYPDLGDLAEFRTYSKLEWRVKLDAARGVSIRSSIEHEYESEINENEDDERHFDLTYFWGVELEF